MELSSEVVILYKIPIFTGVSLVRYKISSAFDWILDCVYNSIHSGLGGMAQTYSHEDRTFLPCMPRRRLHRKIPLTVNAPLHFIASDTLIVP